MQQPTTQQEVLPPQPPEERFWQRYSPHHELPLSGAGSFALHLVVLGVLLLFLVGIIPNWLGTAKHALPVEAVLGMPVGPVAAPAGTLTTTDPADVIPVTDTV